MTMMINNLKIVGALMFGVWVLCAPSHVYAQALLPDSPDPSKPTWGDPDNPLNKFSNPTIPPTTPPTSTSSTEKAFTVDDWNNMRKAAEDKGLSAFKDTGDKYGAGEAIGGAVNDGLNQAKDGALQAGSGVTDIFKGDIGKGAAKVAGGMVKYATAGWTTLSNMFSNITMVGSNRMTYIDPITKTEKTFVRTFWGKEISTEGVDKGCTPIGVEVIKNRDCLFCPLFGVLYTAANEMSTLSFDRMAKPMAKVMLVGFALLIAFKMLTNLSSLTKQDAPKFLGELMVNSFKILLAFLFLQNMDQIYYYFIVPVLGAGLEFGSALLFSIGSDTFTACASNIQLPNDTALLPISLYAKLDCFIRSVQAEISIAQSVGSSLMCVGKNAGKINSVIWDFGMVFQGMIVWGFAIMLSLAFAFYLIDATVMLGIVGALMPFLIACWPFKWTTGYTKKGIEMFLNTFFVYVFMGLVVSVNMQLIGQAMTGGTTITTVASAETPTPPAGKEAPKSDTAPVTGEGESSSGGGLAELAKAISGNDVDALRQMTDIGFGGFLILLCCCIFGFKFTSQATSLADKMAGGGLGIGAGIGGMAASGAAAMGKKATQPARKAVSNKANELTGRAGAAIGKKLGLGGKTGGGGGGAPAPAAADTPPAGGEAPAPAANTPPAGGGGGKGGHGKGNKNKDHGQKGGAKSSKKQPNQNLKNQMKSNRKKKKGKK